MADNLKLLLVDDIRCSWGCCSSLEMGRKSCQLRLSHEGEKCEVLFVEGQARHASYGSLVGDEAVLTVLRWNGGNFEIHFEGKTERKRPS